MGGLMVGGLLFKTVGWRVLAFTGNKMILRLGRTTAVKYRLSLQIRAETPSYYLKPKTVLRQLFILEEEFYCSAHIWGVNINTNK